MSLAVGLALLGYGYFSAIRLVDAYLSADAVRTLPRILASPFDLYTGQAVDEPTLIDRLNTLGYVQTGRPIADGQFSSTGNRVQLIPKGGAQAGRVVTVTFARAPAPVAQNTIASLTLSDDTGGLLDEGGQDATRVTLERPLLATLIDAREKRRHIALADIPDRVVHAVLAIEDRRFYDHAGVDPVRTLAAIRTNLRGDTPYLVGGSTLTQQLVKNIFLTPDKTLRRKVTEQFMALVLERRASKDDILELYLNEVYLGQRGSFAIHGVSEGARLIFGKAVSNLTVAEAATLAGIIQSPPTMSPFSAPERALERRNLVLDTMVAAGYLDPESAVRATREPLQVVARALDAEAPYFVDAVTQSLSGRLGTSGAQLPDIEVQTTLDLHLQHLAEDAVRAGLEDIDRELEGAGPTQAALIAVDPRDGAVLAMVGGRSYNQSQFNRALNARRQPGSVFKPFVYLAAFDATRTSALDLTPATLLLDEPTTFLNGDETWTPGNYGGQYDGPITLSTALARSRNVVAVKVAEQAGYDRVAALWERINVGTAPQPYPSIALGVFEATPGEIAQAYTAFANGGTVRGLRMITRIRSGDEDLPLEATPPIQIAPPTVTFLVTHILRSVVDRGTAASVRAAGLTQDVAGKTGTTNDLRDAWFVGFTPDLLAIVWVGLDDNSRLGMGGAQAALPIWTAFMARALAGRPDTTFLVPEGVEFREIDPETGELATPACPDTVTEAFLANTAPTVMCRRHGS